MLQEACGRIWNFGPDTPPYTNIIKAQQDVDLEEKTAEMNTDSGDLGFQRTKVYQDLETLMRYFLTKKIQGAPTPCPVKLSEVEFKNSGLVSFMSTVKKNKKLGKNKI